jgi:hypothetical protein
MKRTRKGTGTRTLASYYSRVPDQEGAAKAEQQPVVPSPAQEQQGPPSQSQGT